MEAEGRDLWLKFSGRWSGGGDPQDAARFWDTCTNPGSGWGRLMQILERVNPAGRVSVKVEEAIAAFSQTVTQNTAALSSTALQAVTPFNAAKIPPREWLYGRSYIRKFYSVLVAPGGMGKSSLAMIEALAMATGRTLLHGDEPHKANGGLRVWYHNAEDTMDEQHRRLAAAMQTHGVTHTELSGRLFLTSGRESPLRLAETTRDGACIVPGVVDLIVDRARALKLDVIVFDPLSALHTLNENDNAAMNVLVGALREIADRAKISLLILHHTSKAAAGDMQSAGAGASRGASSLVDGARVVRQMGRLLEKDARSAGIASEDRRSYIWVDQGKANLSASQNAKWLRIESVSLANGTSEYPTGDYVGTVQRCDAPETLPAASQSDLLKVQSALGASTDQHGKDNRAKNWVGYLIADALGLDVGAYDVKAISRTAAQKHDRSKITQMIKEWLDAGNLKSVEETNDQRKPITAIVAGDPPSQLDEMGIKTPDVDAK